VRQNGNHGFLFSAKLPSWWRGVQGERRKSEAEVGGGGAEAREGAANAGLNTLNLSTLLPVILIALTVKVTGQLDMALYRLGLEGDRWEGT